MEKITPTNSLSTTKQLTSLPQSLPTSSSEEISVSTFSTKFPTKLPSALKSSLPEEIPPTKGPAMMVTEATTTTEKTSTAPASGADKCAGDVSGFLNAWQGFASEFKIPAPAAFQDAATTLKNILQELVSLRTNSGAEKEDKRSEKGKKKDNELQLLKDELQACKNDKAASKNSEAADASSKSSNDELQKKYQTLVADLDNCRAMMSQGSETSKLSIGDSLTS